VGNGLKSGIAGVMPVGIIDLLEVIGIDHEQAEGAVKLLMFLQRLSQLEFGVAPIGQAGQRITKGKVLEFEHPALGTLFTGQVAEDLDGSGDFPVRPVDGRGADGHGQAVAGLVPQIHFGFAAAAVAHGGLQGAASPAEAATGFIDVAKKIVEAVASDGFVGGVAGQHFGSAIPISDLAVAIDEIDTVMQAVEQLFVKSGVGLGSLSGPDLTGGFTGHQSGLVTKEIRRAFGKRRV
jgi:hypothetical protein